MLEHVPLSIIYIISFIWIAHLIFYERQDIRAWLRRIVDYACFTQESSEIWCIVLPLSLVFPPSSTLTYSYTHCSLHYNVDSPLQCSFIEFMNIDSHIPTPCASLCKNISRWSIGHIWPPSHIVESPSHIHIL